ncbi:MAG: hypothetical protein BWY69_01086 [Planctomycetes bacterium ADurb.Bin401]|nr:MAG: hypothetical protein BWY69_01086 [Planctomycetes bacterium ADurb.Bin401]
MANNFSGYQKKVIKNYYDNLDKIALNKLQELVAEIYLADSEQKKEKLWQRVAQAMSQLKIPKPVAENILKRKDPQILAKNLNDWLK